jgi:hypothetical protein
MSVAATGEVYPSRTVYLIGLVCRLIVAAIITGTYAYSHQVNGALGALTLGVGASILVTRLADAKDIGDQPHPSEAQLVRDEN